MNIVMFVGQSEYSKIVYNHLKKNHTIPLIIKEASKNKKKILKFRLRKFGFIVLLGQLLFVLYSKILALLSGKRIREIKSLFNLKTDFYEIDKLTIVDNINNNLVKDLLLPMNYDLIVVVGTGIINSNILESIKKPIINLHAGITPFYRGVHGAYWALVNNDLENCGVTVHFVDKGVDSGRIICQNKIKITNMDNFCTYPYLQFSEGVLLLDKAILTIENNEVASCMHIPNKGKQWFHPTIFEYMSGRIKGVK
jgi:folate-dependent phosphoribosylglycinamide formyltransferase PurN